jgi:hypothetical protein
MGTTELCPHLLLARKCCLVLGAALLPQVRLVGGEVPVQVPCCPIIC